MRTQGRWHERHAPWLILVLSLALLPVLGPLTLVAVAIACGWYEDRIQNARRRLAARELCYECGYPLIGLPAGSGCPECGLSREDRAK